MKSVVVIQYCKSGKDKEYFRVIYPKTDSLGEESVSGLSRVTDLILGNVDSNFRDNNSLILEGTINEEKHLEVISILHTVRTHDPLMVQLTDEDVPCLTIWEPSKKAEMMKRIKNGESFNINTLEAEGTTGVRVAKVVSIDPLPKTSKHKNKDRAKPKRRTKH